MRTEISPIRDDKDHEHALAEIERLWNSKAGTRDADRLEVLSTLVDAYERTHHAIDPPDPIEAIKFRMEQSGIERSELGEIVGSKVRASEILNRKRRLSLAMIRSLNIKLGIPAEVLIRDMALPVRKKGAAVKRTASKRPSSKAIVKQARANSSVAALPKVHRRVR